MNRYFNADTFFETFSELNIAPYNNFPTADVMSKEDITQKDWSDYWHKLAQSYAHTICVMAEAIAQHGIRQWIPCSDRLPDDDGHYLCSELDGFCYTDSFKEGKWGLVDKYGATCIAWMPLPDPWRGEEDG